MGKFYLMWDVRSLGLENLKVRVELKIVYVKNIFK